MGGRGAFVNVNSNDFTFVEGGQNYITTENRNGIKIIIQKKGPVKLPEYSHSANSIYAIYQKGNLKSIAIYGDDHKQKRLIDFTHEHGWNKVKPHVHVDMMHIKNEPGTPPSTEDWRIINKVTGGQL